jgi:hypothetical protein
MAKRKHWRCKRRVTHSRMLHIGVHGKVADYISHSIGDGTLCINVCFQDKTLLSARFACGMFIIGADISDCKTRDYKMIREYMKPIPR